jgi:hypothetical protein
MGLFRTAYFVKHLQKFYAEHLQGKSVVNQHLGIRIRFNATGKSELAHGRAIHKNKSAVVKCLFKLLEVAEYNNFGNRKTTDSPSVLGFYNFKAKVKIDGEIHSVRISVVITKDLKAYYNHEISIKKDR